MTVLRRARNLAARFGVHVDRMSRQPSQTLLGLAHRPIDLILDIGANSGQFAREMRRRFPKAHIVSFEPIPGPFASLRAWADADGNATALNIGLGEVNATLPMNQHLDHSPSSSFLAARAEGVDQFPQMDRQGTIEVPVRRLDDVLDELDLTATDATFLKLDVQGFEEQVLRGGMRTLARVGALLTEVSLDPLYEGQADFFELYTLARGAGLSYAGNYAQVVGKDGHVVFLDAMFRR